MRNDTLTNEYFFPEAKSIVVSGDIHGEFNLLVNKICVQYQMRNTLVIIAGDCGFGFENKGYYDNIVKQNAVRMNECNNWIVFVRGNHDNPVYFDGKAFSHKRFKAIPDYSIVKASNHTVLCIGGAISIDRKHRQDAWVQYVKKHRGFLDSSPFAKNYYWQNEAPNLDKVRLAEIHTHCSIDTIISHTAPSFCELTCINGLCCFTNNDSALIEDVNAGRNTMDRIYETLISQNHPIVRWCYGHFHQSSHSTINGILFKMLDIMEFYELR